MERDDHVHGREVEPGDKRKEEQYSLLSILGISEARYTGYGQQRLATGELLLYSGHEKENASHTQKG